MFASEFEEATPSRPSKRARTAPTTMEGSEDDGVDDSDDETDGHYGNWVDPFGVREEYRAAFHEITVSDAAYTTFLSLLLYITSGYISFAPLRSASLPLNPKATSARHDALLAILDKRSSSSASSSSSLPFPASPKSIYRLAHLLEITELQSIAFEQFRSSLVVETAALELFSPTSLLREEVQKVVIDFVVTNLALRWRRQQRTRGSWMRWSGGRSRRRRQCSSSS